MKDKAVHACRALCRASAAEEPLAEHFESGAHHHGPAGAIEVPERHFRPPWSAGEPDANLRPDLLQ
jgi:hypothetical protein